MSNFEITDAILSDCLNLMATGHSFATKDEAKDREHYGMLTIWKFAAWNFKEPEFVVTFPFPNRITKLLHSEYDKELVVGTDNGKLYILSLEDILRYPIETNQPTVSLFMSNTVDLIWLVPDEIFVAIGDDNYLKIFNYDEQKIVSGGSLSKRLKDDVLTCMQVNSSIKRIYLGTRANNVLIYDIVEPKYQFKYLFTVSLESLKSPIRSLNFYKE
eukprot:TRINITY_DN13787_c0_g3_i1.p1 TRINITY_DN13787_c0_g3~~TRINITY_DN13787_c0_g3_i1.p1  ORF type:complete len:215 (+),score=53.35 TRINITY_DN13787_c0_g3_i1:402-1046(+)